MTASTEETRESATEWAASLTGDAAVQEKPLPAIPPVELLKARPSLSKQTVVDRELDFEGDSAAPAPSSGNSSAGPDAPACPPPCTPSSTRGAMANAIDEDTFYGTEGDADVRTDSDDSVSRTFVESDSTATSSRPPESSMSAMRPGLKSLAEPSNSPPLLPLLTPEGCGRARRARVRGAASAQNGAGIAVRFSDQPVYYESPWEYDLLPYLNNCEMPDLDDDCNPMATSIHIDESLYTVYRLERRAASCHGSGMLENGAIDAVDGRPRRARRNLRFWKGSFRGLSEPKRRRGLFDDVLEIAADCQIGGASPSSREDVKARNRHETKARAARFFKKGLALLKNGRSK